MTHAIRGATLHYYAVTTCDGTTSQVAVHGRDHWALDRLREAGTAGCTPIDQPAPRWSSYVFNLRQLSIEVETIREQHGPPFQGNHARYVLRSRVEPVSARQEVAA